MADSPIKAGVPHGDGTTGRRPPPGHSADELLTGCDDAPHRSAQRPVPVGHARAIPAIQHHDRRSQSHIWKLAYVGQQWVGLRTLRETKLEERARLEAKRGEVVTEVALAEDNWRLKWVVMARCSTSCRNGSRRPDSSSTAVTRNTPRRHRKGPDSARGVAGQEPRSGPLLDRIEKLRDDFTKAHEQRAKVRQTSTWSCSGSAGWSRT